MRVFTLFVGVLAAGLSAVQAADLPSTSGRDAGLYYSVSGQRIEPMVVWDVQPGVVTRAYWQQPWRNRHYFPATGHKPRYGRHESSRPRVASMPAEPFYRGWTNAEPRSEPLPSPERPLK
jgi:hypothetical protein